MVFKKWNIVYPSIKVYNDLKNIKIISNLFIINCQIFLLIITPLLFIEILILLLK